MERMTIKEFKEESNIELLNLLWKRTNITVIKKYNNPKLKKHNVFY